jgi:hypothetical protein
MASVQIGLYTGMHRELQLAQALKIQRIGFRPLLQFHMLNVEARLESAKCSLATA